MNGHQVSKRAAFLLLIAAAFLQSGCVTATSLVSGNKRLYKYSWAQEVQIGQEADPSIVAEYGLYDDAATAAYVDSVGQYVLRFSHARSPSAPAEVQQTQFFFRVLDSPVVNAFALPGGYIYVTRGLLAHLENEAQLAVVIGHEIGHVVGRHASIRGLNQTLSQALVVGGAVGGQVLMGGDAASTILQGGSSVAQGFLMSYGRDDERESDDLGLEYGVQAGYNVEPAADFFRSLKRLSDRAGQRTPSLLSTHPDPGEREATIHRMAREWEKTHPPGQVGRDKYLRHVDGLIAGENPRNGFVRNSVFYQPDMAFQFPVPESYEVINQPQQVILVASDQASMIRFYLESTASTAREAAENFGSQEGLTVVQSGLGSAYGLPAQFVVVDAPDESGNVTRGRAQFIQYNGQVFAFLGLAAQANYAARERGFIQAMQGFAPLRDAAILGIQPSRVDVRALPSPAVFSSLFPSDGSANFSLEELAILNQVELSARISAGTKVKHIRQ
ncbi:MAG: putative Zn-dependent protease [Rhodothermales bacterium]|jgi:predicted Zn-dependent protease